MTVMAGSCWLFMFCHEDAEEAARIARDPLNRYLKSLVDAASGWVDGGSPMPTRTMAR